MAKLPILVRRGPSGGWLVACPNGALFFGDWHRAIAAANSCWCFHA